MAMFSVSWLTLITLVLITQHRVYTKERRDTQEEMSLNSAKAKIITNEGNLAFQVFANRNISFLTGNHGDVIIGATSLKALIAKVEELSKEVARLKQTSTVDNCAVAHNGKPQTCSERGVCISVPTSVNLTGYRCVCDPGYGGRHCENQIPCPISCCNRACLNGGTCQIKGGLSVCKCANGYFGTICQLEVPRKCGGNITGDQITVHSPGFPNAYPSNMDCKWIIRGTPGKIYRIMFAGFHLESSKTCSKDFLEIRNGASPTDQVLLRTCGAKQPSYLLTTGNEVYIRFKTDNTGEFGNGFSLMLVGQKSEICGGSITEESGVLASPEWPLSSRKFSTCIWVVSLPGKAKIEFSITEMKLYNTGSKCTSYVEVHDGISTLSPIIAKYCSSETPAKLITTSNKLYVKFTTDGNGSKFRSEYQAQCGGNITGLTGYIESPYFPGYYPNKKVCTWTLSVPVGNIIVLSFLTFDIEPGNNCAYDYVAVHNGPSANSPRLGQFCGTSAPTPVMSSMNTITVVFKTDGSKAFRGFRASYTSTVGGCGGAFVGLSGTIQSPSHRAGYPDNVRCVWKLSSSDSSKVVQLQFTTFHLENDRTCRFDYVRLFDGPIVTSSALHNTSANQGRFCGTIRPPVTTSSGRSLTVLFVSDASFSKDGFSARWTTVPSTSGCDRYYATPSGQIQSPNYPKAYPSNRLCKNYIVAEFGHQIFLNFRVFHLEIHSRCLADYVKIYDGANVSSPLVGTFCGRTSPGKIVSSGNALLVEFKSDFLGSGQGFYANFTTGLSLCGGYMHTDTGMIQSPNYPNKYRNNAECEWVINVHVGSTITVNITDFNLESSISLCNNDYLELRDGSNSSSRLISTLCGTTPTKTIFSSTRNVMYIRFKTDAFLAGRGFRLIYKSGCGSVLTNIRGSFQSPNYPQNYPPRKICQWTIKGNLGDTVNVTFTDFYVEYSSTCRYDNVTIYNGQSTSASKLGTYCGRRSAWSVISTANTIMVQFKTDSTFSYRGFKAEYTIQGCSGQLSAKNGTFASPNYPGFYANGRRCHWKITVGQGMRIQLNFSEIDIEDHVDCSFDSLTIFNGPNTQAPVLGKYCSRRPPMSLITSSNTAYIVFKSDLTTRGRGFKATYQTIPGGCGGIIRSSSGYIHSPNYPSLYPKNVNCRWIIEVQSSHNIQLNFTKFHLEQSSNCKHDFVKVYDGYGLGAAVLLSACGSNLPGIVQSTGNVMIIEIKSDSSLQFSGFKAYYKMGCGGTINADQSGVISSPFFPKPYPQNSNCLWILRSSLAKKVTLTFTNFDLEKTFSACNFDYVEVRLGSTSNSTLAGKFCGTTLPHAITSPGAMYVKFISDDSSSRPGFRGVYSTAYAGCGGRFSGESGMFVSPQYPYKTPRVVDCVWRISVAPGSTLSLSFFAFSLFGTCTDAFLEVRDGITSTSKSIGKFCGTNLPPTLRSAKENLYIRFYSSAAQGSTGFRAQYTASCNNVLTYTQGFIASPNWPSHYPHSRTCVWTVQVPTGRRISVRFTNFDMEENLRCLFDYLEARDGGTGSSLLIGRYCGISTPQSFTTTGNQLYLRFNSDHISGGNGFRLQFDAGPLTTPAPGCGGVYNAAENQQYISSPNYPGNYSNSIRCTWIINAPLGHSILLKFTDFQLQSSFFCLYDYVLIRDGNTISSRSLGRYCGTSMPPPIHTESSYLSVLFVTNNGVVNKGFRASYEKACGGIRTTTNGIIHSPTKNGRYVPNANCTWKVKLNDGRIELQFSSFKLELSGSCSKDYLEVRDGPANDSPLLGKFCGSAYPQNITTTSSNIFLQFVSDSSIEDKGFNISYSKKVQGCRGVLTLTDMTAEAVLTSPGYPQNYRPQLNCQWTLNVPLSETVEFHLRFIDIETSSTCRWDALEIYDGSSSSSRRMGLFCGNQLPVPSRFVSKGNQLFVSFRSDRSSQGKGFRATWRIGCGGTYTELSGRIVSPGYPNSYSPNRNCSYVIHLPVLKQIQLQFNTFSLEGSSPCTNGDYLEIINGDLVNGTRLKVLCGTQLPAPMLPSGSVLAMRFHTNRRIQSNGFEVRYRAIGTVCGGRLSTSSGSFQSPHFPSVYTNNRECQWIIEAPTQHSVQLSFKSFKLQSSPSCTADYLEVYNGETTSSPVLGKFCGENVVRNITSSGTRMLVRFVSNDDNIVSSGFQATYNTYLPGCGGSFVAVSGTIMTPHFPGKYPPRVSCTWTLTVPSGNIFIKFLNFSVEDHSSCFYDSVILRDGNSKSSPLIVRLCGTKGQGYNYTSAGRSMVIQFSSDFFLTDTGFKLIWNNRGGGKVGCGGTISQSSGSIQSPFYPNNYPANVNCVWSLLLPPGRIGILQLNDLNMETSLNCTKDRLLIRNGYTGTSPVLATLCEPSLPSLSVFNTSQNYIRVEFKTDQAGTGRGFKLTFNASIDGCGGTLTDDSGVITSPNYPKNYPGNADCAWTIKVSGQKRITLYFDAFNLQAFFSSRPTGSQRTTVTRCRFDFLEIHNGSTADAPLIDKLCGFQHPSPIISSGNALYLRFKTDSQISNSGFRIHYTTGCGGVIRSSNAVIMSPNFPYPYAPNTDCIWTIRIQSHRHIKLEFLEFNLPSTSGKCLDYVEIRNGSDMNAPLIGQYCNEKPASTLRHSNVVFLKFHSDGSSNTFKGFKANYKSVCGGLITNTFGTLASSTTSDGVYFHGEDCVWVITFPVGQRVTVRFLSFKIELHSICQFDYLEIRDGDNSKSPLLGRFCGAIKPAPFTSSGRSLYIRFKTDDSIHNDGFRLEYSTAAPKCGGEFTSSSRVFTTPNYPNNYPRDEDCGWVIVAPEGQRIKLTFDVFQVEGGTARCLLDYVEVREGKYPSSHLITRACGVKASWSVTSAGNSLFVRFHSDFLLESKGFRASYQWVRGCGGFLNATQLAKTLLTPNYPNYYQAGTVCDWLIGAREGYKISLKFDEFSFPAVASNGKCLSYVQVRNGPHQGAPVDARTYCGSAFIPTYISDRNTLRIIMNGSIAAKGFNATYKEADCNENVSKESGQLTSPNYPGKYPLDMNCISTLTVPVGRRISLFFRDFYIEPHNNCNYDFLEIHDGKTEKAALLGGRRWCGQIPPPSLVSSGNTLYIRFKTDRSTQHIGYAMTYTSATGACGGPLTGRRGAFTSPGFSRGYNDTYDCTWIITAATDKKIRLSFQIFHLPYAASCTSTDFVEVRNGGLPSSSLVSRFCGSNHPADYLSATNKLFVRFKSTLRTDLYKGFLAYFDEV